MITFLIIFVFAAALPITATFVVHHFLSKDEKMAEAAESK